MKRIILLTLVIVSFAVERSWAVACTAPTGTPGSRCGTGTVVLSATSATAGQFKWYTALTGGTPTFTSAAGVTSSSFTSPSITTTKTYYVTFTGTGCTESSPRVAVIATVNAVPATPSISAGAAACAGGTGVTITSTTSVVGINYQLQLGTTAVGTAKAGTGSSLTWTNITTAGTTYNVKATNATTGCVSANSSNVTVTINPLPTSTFTVSGGTVCAPGTITVGLSGSQSGANFSYQLKLNGVNSGTAVIGTGAAISFGVKSASGVYTVVATNTTTNCSATMTGSATINPLPNSTYVLSGGAGICPGGSVTLTLSNSEVGVNYQLKLTPPGGSIGLVGAVVAGTGAALSWPSQTALGAYTVTATNATTACTATFGSTSITANPVPTAFNVAGNGPVCVGASTATITLNNSQTLTTYQLYRNTTANGTPVTGTGASLTWPNLPDGAYTIIATNSNGCTANMTPLASATITTNPLPNTFTMQVSNTSYCPGTGGVTVTVPVSQSGVNYQIKVNGTPTGTILAGNGSLISWPGQTAAGTYSVVATIPATGCNLTQGSAVVSVNGLPVQYAVGGGGQYVGTGPGLPITLAGSEATASYQLLLAGSPVGTPMAGTGSSLTWSNQTTVGTYTVLATGNATTCTQTMTGSATISLDPTWVALDNWAFLYKYDNRRRMTHKKVPGADWVYMVYDNLDRLVLTQDGEQRKTNKWAFTKYDAMSRPVMTGLYTHTATLDQVGMSALISTTAFFESYDGTAPHGYTNTVFASPSFAAANFDVLTVTYYDNYNFKTLWGGTAYNYVNDALTYNGYTQPASEFTSVLGHPTGTKTKVLDGTNTYLKTISYYDDHYRVLQTITDNTKASTDRSSSLYDFTGKVIKTLSIHRVGAGTLQHVVARRMDYDHAGRLMRAYHTLDTQPEVLQVSNEYNELGQLVDKKLHSTDGTNFKQSVDHRYNIRGWLTSINNSALANDGVTNDETTDLYGMELAYNQTFTGVTTAADAQYNGNISAIKWSANLGIANEKERAYKFSYDGMNRLTGATYNARTAGAWAANGAFDENNFTYDLNGNIKSLSRKSFDFDVTHAAFTMDNLTYDYGTGPATSNKLLKVSDSGDKTKGFVEPASTTGNDYIYDANGNMTSDQNKGITAITYNHLNLPVQVNKGASDYIVYTYDAGGRKLSQQVFGSTPKVTDYMGEFIYEGNVLQFVNTEEGRIVMTGANPEYQYHLKDHLGNVRTTFTTVTTPELNTATYETANLTAEMGKFLRMDKARRVNSTLFDRTNGSSAGFSERLNGTANEKYGLARSIAVSSGDVVSAEVYAKYPDTNSANWLPALSTLMGNIATNTGNIVVDGSNYANGNNPFNALFAQAHTPNGTAPQAYLNWMVFDKNWNLISSKSGYMQITTAGRETGSDVAHERLFTPSISITEPGYVYIYVSNEDLAAPKDVFFDDFSVTQVKTPIVQVEDYYPFGLTFNSYQRDSSLPDQYLYNGKELRDELSLGWLDYGNRIYDATTTRFSTQDGDSYVNLRFSQYAYAICNPIRYEDRNGDGPDDRILAARMLIGLMSKYSNLDDNTGDKARTGFSQEALRLLDCTEFVCRVMEADGITNTVRNMSRQPFVDFMNSPRFQKSDTPRKGDIAVWYGVAGYVMEDDKKTLKLDANGQPIPIYSTHAGIVTDVNNAGEVKLAHAANPYSIPNVQENKNFTSITNYRGDIPFIGYFRPVKETKDGKQISVSMPDKKFTGPPTMKQSLMIINNLLHANSSIKLTIN
ncbi:MAG: RHS repeat-associated core domain-containing protein [Cyclobacteriaceae bacterium]